MKEEFVPLQEIKRRSVAASNLARKIALEKNKRWVGWSGEVLVDEVGKVPSSWVGRNFVYKPVAVKGAENLLGRTLHVRILRAFSTHLEGEIIK
jgi:tRNA A37 methylthiotransferase MiaB